jgi:hypothetical protein
MRLAVASLAEVREYGRRSLDQRSGTDHQSTAIRMRLVAIGG